MKKIGLIGLGRMGYNLALNMVDNNIEVLGYDKFVTEEVKNNKDILIFNSIKGLIAQLPKPAIIWLMVPAGEITDNVIQEVSSYLSKYDIIIDGGNSNYNDTIKRYQLLKTKQINFVDCGTSGGTDGARYGASLMVGGDKAIVKKIEWLFEGIATKNGYAYIGESGSGHFVKMVHNGIEYGMMQAIGEGFDLLEKSGFDLNYQDISRVWANGSIIQGLLMDTAHQALMKDKRLDQILGRVDDSGEGQWTIEAAFKYKASIPVIAQALFARYKSRDEDHFSEKIVAAMRNEFGGHKVYKKQ
ncbi:MAG: decarboxylating 6-phosphogluconate dehydrogenase [Candidatus Izemoplasmatales bacterium]|nr:decarboxylating 6-phosphogluconate dehydrogenase [Candidatus Izemoplasmatales bacterium]